MISSISRSARLAGATAVLLTLCSHTQADAQYCSSFNTAETPRSMMPPQPEVAAERASLTSPSASPTTTTPPISSSTSSSSSSSSSTTTTTSNSQSPTWTPVPSTSLDTAIPGVTRTIIAIPTAPPGSPATTPAAKSKSGGLGTGGAVGLTIGLVAMAAAIVAGVFFWLRKRRQDRKLASEELGRKGSVSGFGGAPLPSRTMSENSRYVLGTDGRRVVENWEPGEVEEIRRSRLMPVDQRLDPFSAVYKRGDNKSTESINTIRDDHDYSRRVASGPAKILRATNPD
ncbi:putative Cell wall integrity and stress response component 4 [Diplocarpon rosae]|nr:putative Cell wall integrity and stress response component 4 [Diplocarpon rosae]